MVYTFRNLTLNITFPYLIRTQNRLAGCFKTYSCTIWGLVFVMWCTGDCKLGLARTKGVRLAAAETLRLPSVYSVLVVHERISLCYASEEIVQTAVFNQMFTEQEGKTIKRLDFYSCQTWFESRLITRYIYIACFFPDYSQCYQEKYGFVKLTF
jgi:hypothetical protein